MVNHSRDKFMKVVEILVNDFDGKITQFPEIRSRVFNVVKGINNSFIRRVLYFLNSIGVVDIQKGLSGHFTVYNDVVIEDYYFDFNRIYDTVMEYIRKYVDDSTLITICDDKLYIDPLFDEDFITNCTRSDINFLNVSYRDVDKFVRGNYTPYNIIEFVLDHSFDDFVFDVLKEYYKKNGS